MGILKLFKNEFNHFYKQTLIFGIISMFLFALSISAWCFAIDMIEGYKNFLDDNLDVAYLTVNDFEDIHTYKEIDKLGSALYASVNGITYYPNLTNVDFVKQSCCGSAYVFRDNLPYKFRNCKFRGKAWCATDNKVLKNMYPIFLSESTAEELAVEIGDSINYEYYDKFNIAKLCQMVVRGIYSVEKDVNDDFVIPFSLVLELVDDLPNITFNLELQTPSDALDVYPKLKKMGVGCNSMYVPIDEINLINIMRYILITVSVVVLILTFFVLNSILTITVKSRMKFMAKLKLLGASTKQVAILYYFILILAYIIAFAFSLLLSYVLCDYFSSIATLALSYSIKIRLHYVAILGLLVVSGVLILLRYLIFGKKVKKITPLAFIKEG